MAFKLERFQKYLPALPILIMLLGLGLRLNQLGKDSFWLDEAGVAIAAQKPDLFLALAEARTHMMAMPLDYVVDWIVARVCTNEACLRFPAAIWGTLTLWVSYRLFRRFGNEKIALIGMAFLALSPFHIRYSQETRFYASMLFFYVLASELLFAAIQKPSLARWMVFTTVTIIGVYFHVYVLFALVNGFFWLAFTKWVKQDRKTWIYYWGSGLVILMFMLPGYLFFTYHLKSDYQFANLADTVVSLMKAWGWLPQVAASGLTWVWYGLMALFSLFGFYWSVRRLLWPVAAIIPSMIVQITAILLSDYLWNYFVDTRQFLIVLPFMCFFAALGLSFSGGQGLIIRSSDTNPNLQSKLIRWVPTFISIIFLGLITISYIPAVSDYYRLERSHGREISEILNTSWAPGDVIYVNPTYETVLFQYYLARIGRTDISSSLLGTKNVAFISAKSSQTRSDYIITPPTPPDATQWIEQSGFQRQYPPGNTYSVDAQYLWVRKP